MSQTVFLAKEEPGGASGFIWTVGGEDGAIEIDAAYAQHLLSITGNDFFIVTPKEKKAEKTSKPTAKVETVPSVETPPVLETDDDLTEALKVAKSTTPTKK